MSHIDRVLEGRRVRLVRCNDPYTRKLPGVEGVITFVDSMGTVHVRWDDGTMLGLVRDAGDDFLLLPERGEDAP